MAKSKATPKETTTQVWTFTPSQTLLITEQARIHETERLPLERYQAKAQNELLESFIPELGIPKGTPLNVDLDRLEFTVQATPDAPPATK